MGVFIEGSATIATITPTADMAAGGGEIILVPDTGATWSTTTAGNIAGGNG